jgi:hypothetical protein
VLKAFKWSHNPFAITIFGGGAVGCVLGVFIPRAFMNLWEGLAHLLSGVSKNLASPERLINEQSWPLVEPSRGLNPKLRMLYWVGSVLGIILAVVLIYLRITRRW